MGVKKQTEKEFMALVIQLAKLTGWSHFHTHDSRRSPAGYPDLVLCRPPRLIFAELKTDTGRVDPEQQVWLDRLRRCGCEAFLWRPSMWSEIERVLQGETDA